MQTIIHVEYNGEHSYYGCIREVFDHFSSEQVGMPYSTFSKRQRVDIDTMYVSKDGSFKMRKGIVNKRHPQKQQTANTNNVEKEKPQVIVPPTKQTDSHSESNLKQTRRPSNKKDKTIDRAMATSVQHDEDTLYSKINHEVTTLSKMLDDIYKKNTTSIDNASIISGKNYKNKIKKINSFYETVTKRSGIDSFDNDGIKMNDFLNKNSSSVMSLLDELLDLKIDITSTERDDILKTLTNIRILVFELLAVKNFHVRLF